MKKRRGERGWSPCAAFSNKEEVVMTSFAHARNPKAQQRYFEKIDNDPRVSKAAKKFALAVSATHGDEDWIEQFPLYMKTFGLTHKMVPEIRAELLRFGYLAIKFENDEIVSIRLRKGARA